MFVPVIKPLLTTYCTTETKKSNTHKLLFTQNTIKALLKGKSHGVFGLFR